MENAALRIAERIARREKRKARKASIAKIKASKIIREFFIKNPSFARDIIVIYRGPGDYIDIHSGDIENDVIREMLRVAEIAAQKRKSD